VQITKAWRPTFDEAVYNTLFIGRDAGESQWFSIRRRRSALGVRFHQRGNLACRLSAAVEGGQG
jgi:hypothetical protein